MTFSDFYAFIKKQIGMGGKLFRDFCGMKSGPWCCAYVTYNFHKTGNKALFYGGKKVTYCPTAIKWCRAFLAQVPLFLALPGDIIFFDWNRNNVPDHIGHAKIRINNSSILTHEGNTSGGIVAEKERTAKYVLGVFRPHFKPKPNYVKKCRLLEDDTHFGHLAIYNLQLALGLKATGILTKSTVQALQKKAGATPDGAWLIRTSIAIQKMTGATPDGDFYNASIIALKKWINKQNGYGTVKKTTAKEATSKQKTTTTAPASPAAKPKATTEAKKPAAKPAAPAKKGYTGTFPALNNNRKIINSMAYRMCYPHDTPQKTYKYDGGKPKPAYAKGIDKIFPTHKKWKNKRQRVGACCDIFVAVCLGYVGIKVKKDLKDQLVDMPKMKSLKSNGHHKASEFVPGDVVQRGRKDRSGHTFVICGVLSYDKKTKKWSMKKYVANSHYKKLGGTYAVMDAKPKDIDPKDWKYYKCYTVEGAIRTWYGIGDYGYDVLYIQLFLKWAGFFKGTCNGDYNKLTAEAVKKFQKSLGWEPNKYGRCGEQTIKAMKAYKK